MARLPTHAVSQSHSSDPLYEILRQIRETTPYQQVGTLERVVGLMIETRGPKVRIGELCYVETGNPYQPLLPAEVVGFKDGMNQLMPLGEMEHLSPGDRVYTTGGPFQVPVSDALCGRVIDALGNPLDDRPPISTELFYHTYAHAPHPLKRQGIETPMPLGVRAIDGFLTLGKGQRVGIFAGSGVGKSTTLGMIARNTEADINVIALIGERGREVREFVEQNLGQEGLERSVVVVSTSEQPGLLKIKAALTATTIAEYFRQQGKNVLLMMDSLTRVAMALREVGLAVGEPPATRGYTPSVFAFMPKLLERAGCSDTGSITGLYTVLVEGDDLNEPVTDTVRGLVDGHIVLSRALADQAHFPAIDVPASISRLMSQLASTEHRQAAEKVREMIALYRKSEDLINIGAYVPGNNLRLDRAVSAHDRINAFLRQEVHEKISFENTLHHLSQLLIT